MKITIPGNPIPQARPRYHISTKGNVMVYDPQSRDKVITKRLLAKKIDNHFPDLEPLEVADIGLTFYMKIPKSLRKADRLLAEAEQLRHTTKPDCDNLVKYVLDCLTDTFLKDDNGVNLTYVKKIYSTYPRVEIEINHGVRDLSKILFQDALPDSKESGELRRESKVFWNGLELSDCSELQRCAYMKDHH